MNSSDHSTNDPDDRKWTPIRKAFERLPDLQCQDPEAALNAVFARLGRPLPSKPQPVPRFTPRDRSWIWPYVAAGVIAIATAAVLLLRNSGPGHNTDEQVHVPVIGSVQPPVTSATTVDDGHQTISMAFIDVGQTQGPKPDEPGTLNQLTLILPTDSKGFLTLVERHANGRLTTRPNVEQSWQRIEPSDRPRSITPDPVFTGDPSGAKVVFALVSGAPIVEIIKQWPAADSLDRRASDAEFLRALRTHLRERSVVLSHAGWITLPANPEKK